MTRTRHGRFDLESWGNGFVYVLINRVEHKSVFVQGVDALSFESDMEAIEACFPQWDTERVLFWLWDVFDYGHAAVDCEMEPV